MPISRSSLSSGRSTPRSGFGLSRGLDRSSTINASARVVADLLRDLGPAHLFGSSMGAAVAVRAAVGAPTHVASITMIGAALPTCGPCLWLQPPPSRVWLPMIPGLGYLAAALYDHIHTPERAVNERLRAWCVDAGGVDEDTRRRLSEIIAARRAFPEAAGSYADAAASVGAYLARADQMARDLQRLSAPALIVHGADDRIVPARLARAVARECKSVALTVLEDCGHVPHLEIAGRFLDAVWAHLLAVGGAPIEQSAKHA